MRSKVSILGLYYHDNSIFDGFAVPEGLDRQIAIDQILQECAELEILFPSAEFMKDAITRWSTMYQNTWKRLYDTTVVEYNPIHNYDRVETRDLKVRGTTNSGHKVAAFNSSELEPTYGDTSTGESCDTGTIHTAGNIGITTTQDMLSEERLSVLYNVYDSIVSMFKQRFCLLVY